MVMGSLFALINLRDQPGATEAIGLAVVSLLLGLALANECKHCHVRDPQE